MKTKIELDISETARKAIAFNLGVKNINSPEPASQKEVELWLKRKILEEVQDMVQVYEYARQSLHEFSASHRFPANSYIH